MTGIFENALDMFSRYIGNGLYMIFFLLAFLAVCIFVKDKKQRSFLLGYFILIQIIYWCPISAYVITEFGIGRGVYWRMLWLLPMVLVTAWGLTLFIGHIYNFPKKALAKLLVKHPEEKPEKMAAKRLLKLSLTLSGVVLASFLLTFCGNSMYKNGLFQESPNSYKLPAEVFGICDTILEDAGDTPIKSVMPDDLVCHVRQYTSKIHLSYGRDGGKDKHFDTPEDLILFNIMNNSYQDPLTLAEGVRLAGCNYMVLYASDSRNDFMADYQITELTRVNNYVVYRVE